MNRELKLHFLKQLVNWPLRVLNRFLVFPKSPRYPQTVALLSLYGTLRRVYSVEVKSGVFDVPDGNFERLFTVAIKVLAQVSERDRYYRAWVGLFFLLAARQVELMDTDPVVLKRLIKEQWGDDVDFLPDITVQKWVAEFREVALCSYLGNVAGVVAGDVANKNVGGIKCEC
jgi:hypothetical protein